MIRPPVLLKFAHQRSLALVALAFLLTLLLYWQGLSGPFMLDDFANVVRVHLTEFTWDGFVFTITHNTSGVLGRLVSVVSFVLSGLQFGIEPWGYKLHNLLLHLLTALLLWRLLSATLPVLQSGLTSGRSEWIAAIATAIWLIHPLHVSTVLYVVQRMTILSSLFTVAALLCYVEVRKRNDEGVGTGLLAFLIYPALQLLAVFSKENGALLPLYLLFFEVFVFRSWQSWTTMPRMQKIFLCIFAILPLILGILILGTQFERIADYSTRNFSLGERLLSQAHVLVFYVRLILLPRIRDMSLYHDDFPVTTGFDPLTLVLLLFWLGVVATIWLCRNKAPVVSFGLGWFLVGHVMESTIIPLELVFEHRNYLPLIGLVLPLVFYAENFKEKKLVFAVIGVFALIMAVETAARSLEWSNEELMGLQAVNDHPRSVRAHTSYANELTGQNKMQEAIAQLDMAAEVQKKDAGILMHKLTLLCAQELRSEELMARIVATLSTYPVSIYALNSFENLYTLINNERCKQVTQDDMARMLEAARSQLGNTNNNTIKGYLLRLKGFQALLSGEYVEGVVAMREAYDANGDIMLLVELIASQLNYGQVNDASDTLQFMREENKRHFGIEQYQLRKVEASVAKAREAAANAAPEAPAQ